MENSPRPRYGKQDPFWKIPLQLATELEEVSFKWIKRESNEAAHVLAKWGLANRWHGFVVLSSLLDQVWHVFRKDVAGCINICS
jgi:ribonuclease HI